MKAEEASKLVDAYFNEIRESQKCKDVMKGVLKNIEDYAKSGRRSISINISDSGCEQVVWLELVSMGYEVRSHGVHPNIQISW